MATEETADRGKSLPFGMACVHVEETECFGETKTHRSVARYAGMQHYS